MGGCCTAITDALKQVLGALGPILSIALLCVAAYFLLLAGPEVFMLFEEFAFLPEFITTLELSSTAIGYLALGAAVIIDPEGVTDIVVSGVNAIGTIAGAVVAAGLGGLTTGLLGSNGGFFIIGAVLLYLFLRAGGSKKEDNEPPPPVVEQSSSSVPPSPVRQDEPFINYEALNYVQ